MSAETACRWGQSQRASAQELASAREMSELWVALRQEGEGGNPRAWPGAARSSGILVALGRAVGRRESAEHGSPSRHGCHPFCRLNKQRKGNEDSTNHNAQRVVGWVRASRIVATIKPHSLDVTVLLAKRGVGKAKQRTQVSRARCWRQHVASLAQDLRSLLRFSGRWPATGSRVLLRGGKV